MTKWFAVTGLLLSFNIQAWDCRYDRDLDESLDVTGTVLLKVEASAGDLRIEGEPGLDQVRIRGKVCTSDEEWLDEVRIETQTGTDALIAVVTPDTDGWSLTGNNYAYVDLELYVPEGLDLDVRDSSGGLKIENVAALSLQDSSGDILIRDALGPVEVQDSSGDIEFLNVSGDVTVISDSSGDIDGRDIGGDVLVERDSSGKIEFSQVGGSVTVERDSSGDIEVSDIEGDFTVLRDGSGSIDAEKVNGTVDIPENKKS